MGCLNSSEANASRKIDQAATSENKKAQEKHTVKLLLLGAGDSGKSTVLKQLRAIYGIPLTEQEKIQLIPVVHHNIIVGMKILIEQARKFGSEDDIIELDSANIVSCLDDNAVISVDIGRALKSVWNSPAVAKAWERRSDFQIDECVGFFLPKIDAISQQNYIVSHEDVVHSRVRTNGIVKQNFKIDEVHFELFDVGGQRNERRKWIHCFDDVTAVIFVAALSEYDQSLYENSDVNRMIEALELFTEVCNMRYFQNSSMILFLNKKDLFEEKVKVKSIRSISHFSDFQGGLGDYKLGLEYFVKKFLKANSNSCRVVYHHITCATDTKNVEVVFNACKDTIHRGNLKDCGIMI